jgi:hypothetical protein
VRRYLATGMLVFMCIQPFLSAEQEAAYSICLAAPPSDDASGPIAPGMDCKNRDLAIQIGRGTKMPWPTQNTKLENVRLRKGDLIIVFCKEKPQQSFRFSARWLETHDLVVHLDGYRLIQLFDAKSKPWYKCKTKS